MSMLIAGACCCGDDEPPPPTCLDCPKPALRLFYSYRGEAAMADAANGYMRIERTKTSTYAYTLAQGYNLVSFTDVGTLQLSGACGSLNLTVSPAQPLETIPFLCSASISPRLGSMPFSGSGLLTVAPNCCEPVVPSTPCSEIYTNVIMPGIGYLTNEESKLPSGSFLVWDGCDVYADDAAYQEVVRDSITNKVVLIYSESASWGAVKI